jgi:hypothetical protein
MTYAYIHTEVTLNVRVGKGLAVCSLRAVLAKCAGTGWSTDEYGSSLTSTVCALLGLMLVHTDKTNPVAICYFMSSIYIFVYYSLVSPLDSK